MKEKVLILGGGGFIGMNIAKYLNENRDYKLTIADNYFYRDFEQYFSESDLESIEILESDLTLESSFNKLDKDYKYVYMLASVVGVNNTIENPEEVIRVNTSIIMNSLNWLSQSEVSRVLFTSTSEAYAGTIENDQYKVPTDEKIPLTINNIKEPRFAYAVTKILGESAFLNYSKNFSFSSTIVRYHNVFGPDMGFKHVIPHLVERFIKKEDPFLMYGFDQTRSFSYISDVAEGSVLALESPHSKEEIYHLGSEEEVTIEELIKFVGKLCNFAGVYKEADTFPGSVKRRCPDISKSKREFGYEPKINWKEGVEITVNWYKDYFLQEGSSKKDGFKSLEELGN